MVLLQSCTTPLAWHRSFCYTLTAPSNYLNQYFESINDLTRYSAIYSRAIFVWILNVSIPEMCLKFKDFKSWPYLSGRNELRVFYGTLSMGSTQITMVKSKGNLNAWHWRYVECLIMSLCASMPSFPELQNDSECIANELKQQYQPALTMW